MDMVKDRLYSKNLSVRIDKGNFLNKSSPLQKLYRRQQPKMQASPRKAALLKTFADDDYKKIAKLIQKWLNETN